MSEIVDLGEQLDEVHPAPVAVVDTELIRRTNPYPEAIERSHAHLVIVATAGSGTHLVDFGHYPVTVGTAIHVQPGQVQRFDHAGTFSAVVLLIRPEVCPAGLFVAGDTSPLVELGPAGTIVGALAGELLREYRAPDCDDAIMATGATLLLRHLARASRPSEAIDRSGSANLVRAFRAELERSFATNRSVAHYAAEIGTSARTLARATVAQLGLSPKELIDQRVSLEAKRLLVHTDDPVATIGARLGFSEGTNFTKFFTRLAGRGPNEFRDRPTS